MSEWVCPYCNRLNLWSPENKSQAPVCHYCKKSLDFSSKLEHYLEEIESHQELIDETNSLIQSLQGQISDLECELSPLLIRRDNLNEEILEYKVSIEKVNQKIKQISELKDKYELQNNTPLFCRNYQSDICQKSLATFKGADAL